MENDRKNFSLEFFKLICTEAQCMDFHSKLFYVSGYSGNFIGIKLCKLTKEEGPTTIHR